MLYALNSDGAKIAAAGTGGRAACPDCAAVMLAKCGPIVIWHWAHESLADCDAWSEGESRWHLEWKKEFPPECVEVRMGPHRADIVTGSHIIELQHSAISVEDILEREDFYGEKLVWLFDASAWLENVRFREHPGKPYHGFRWKWMHKRQRFCGRPIYWDLGDDRIFQVGRIWDDGNNGYGYFLSKSEFLARFTGGATESDKAVPPNPNGLPHPWHWTGGQKEYEAPAPSSSAGPFYCWQCPIKATEVANLYDLCEIHRKGPIAV